MAQSLRSRKLLVILAAYLVVAVFFMPYLGKDLPFSVFYHTELKSAVERINKENKKRAIEAETTLQKFQASKFYVQEVSRKEHEFCFAIPSISRPYHVNYLTQLVASLLPQVASTDSVFVVLNTEGPGHIEANELSSIVPVQTITRNFTQERSVYAKETSDYMYALKWCYKQGAKFTVILEDDVLLPENFIDRLRFVLQYRMPSDEKSWAFLKLYYPEKWQGWSNESGIILELLLTTVLGGLLLSLLIYIFLILFLQEKLRKSELACLFFLSSILVMYVLISLGRPHLLSLRNFSPHLSAVVPAPGCCTPAVLYPKAHLSSLIQFLQSAHSSRQFPVDYLLDKFARNKSLDRLLVVPNMVKHIGYVSTLKKKKNPHEFNW